MFNRYYSALSRRCLGTITRFRTARSVVALTFDDGPDPETTPAVLDLLERHGARGTFFVVGEAAAAEPGLLHRMLARGHTLANHTWSHRSVARLSREQRRQEIRACARALAPHGTRLFRPPWGEQTVAARLDAWLLRHEVVGWNVDGGDWRNPDPLEIARHLSASIAPGSIVLLHDAIRSPVEPGGPLTVHRDRTALLTALDLFLRRYSARYDFVTLPEMFRAGRPVRHAWFLPSTAAIAPSVR